MLFRRTVELSVCGEYQMKDSTVVADRLSNQRCVLVCEGWQATMRVRARSDRAPEFRLAD